MVTARYSTGTSWAQHGHSTGTAHGRGTPTLHILVTRHHRDVVLLNPTYFLDNILRHHLAPSLPSFPSLSSA